MFTVAPHCQIMTQLGLKDPSHNLHSICVIDFFLPTFNTPCMCPNIRCDGMKIFVLGTKQGLSFTKPHELCHMAHNPSYYDPNISQNHISTLLSSTIIYQIYKHFIHNINVTSAYSILI